MADYPSSKPIYLNNRMTAINFLNSCTVPLPLDMAVLRCYINHVIIVVVVVVVVIVVVVIIIII